MANAAVEVEDKKTTGKLFSDTGIDGTDLGRPDSLRYTVLRMVLDERYDSAIEELREFLNADSEYPDFKTRIGRFINHSIDLIYAIKAKRSFPGISSLTRAKQQELREKFKEHLKELQQCIKIIEKNQTDLRVTDARSTIYVVRAGWYSLASLALLGFYLEITQGFARTTLIVFEETLSMGADWLVALLKL
jgi:hypothetical protein